MSASPNVVVLTAFYRAGGKGRPFYSSASGVGGNDYLHYVDTAKGVVVTPDYLAYAGNAEKSSGAFDESGLLDEKGKQELRAKLRSTGSTIWDFVISFEGEFGMEKMHSWEDARELVAKELPGLLKENRLSYRNVTWYAGLHTNTDNRHIHLSFFENSPGHYVANEKEPKWHYGYLNKLSLTNFRVHLEQRLTSKEYDLSSYRRRLMDDCDDSLNKLSDYERHQAKLRKKLSELEEMIPREGDYASKSMDAARGQIDSIVTLLIQGNPEMMAEFTKLLSRLAKSDEATRGICERDKTDPAPYLLADKFQKDFYRRMGNKVIEYVREAKKADVRCGKAVAKERRARWREKAIKDSLIHHTASLEKRCDEEAIDCLEDFERRLKKAEHDRLVEEGEIEPDK
jgi:hypothetical protein